MIFVSNFINKSPFSHINSTFGFPLILFFEIKTNFFWKRVTCVFFYSFYNKYASFVICKNDFCFLLVLEKYKLAIYVAVQLVFILVFLFKNLDLIDPQTTQFDFSLSNLWFKIISVIFTP